MRSDFRLAQFVCLGDTSGTFPALEGLRDASFLDRLGRCLLSLSFYLSRRVANVSNVDIDEFEADFLELLADQVFDHAVESIPVLVDLVNVHLCNNGAQLTRDDLPSLVGNFILRQAEQALGSQLVVRLVASHSNCEDGRDVHTNTLE